MNISPARTAAFDILSKIERERAFTSILLPEYEQRLPVRDRALCHQLTLGVLRRQIRLDRLIDHFAAGKNLDLAVRISLRLGLYQLLFLDRVPAHSAINESVNLVRRAKKTSARGLVNAILRRSQREPVTPTYADETDRLSVETSHPRWLIEKWSRRFGEKRAAALAAANNLQPRISFRFTAKAPSKVIFQNSSPSELVPGCFHADPVTTEMTEAESRGEIYFQDEGSQLVGSSVVVPHEGTFLDVCAAPGSKVTQVAASTHGRLLVAGDVHSHRTRFLLENVRKQGAKRVAVVEYDAKNELPFIEEFFDTVLVDAPCSGTGTIRHNPEIRYFLGPEDLNELSTKQRRILRNASKMVRKGGSLIYSTCSLEVEENEMIADQFLASEPDFHIACLNISSRFVVDDRYCRTMPHVDDMDGFFVAAFVRQGPN